MITELALIVGGRDFLVKKMAEFRELIYKREADIAGTFELEGDLVQRWDKRIVEAQNRETERKNFIPLRKLMIENKED